MTRKDRPSAQDFSSLLDSLLAETSGETVTLGQLMQIVERRSFGAVILLLGLIAISPLTIVPGANWLVAAATLLFSVQLLFGARHPVLPRGLLEVKMPRSQLEVFVRSLRKTAHTADRLVRPRLTFLAKPPFVIGTSLICIAASLITFPLGLIPLGPVLPGISILMMGIGLTARDGVFLLLSGLAFGGASLLLVRWLL